MAQWKERELGMRSTISWWGEGNEYRGKGGFSPWWGGGLDRGEGLGETKFQGRKEG